MKRMDWSRYETAFQAIPAERREEARRYVQRLVDRDGRSGDAAVQEALARFGDETRPDAPHAWEAVTSPDVSLAFPHGPEGESHGGRAGRDPLQFVEDSTPAGTNAYSRTRGSPRQAKRLKAPRVGRNVRSPLPRRRTSSKAKRTPGAPRKRRVGDARNTRRKKGRPRK